MKNLLSKCLPFLIALFISDITIGQSAMLMCEMDTPSPGMITETFKVCWTTMADVPDEIKDGSRDGESLSRTCSDDPAVPTRFWSNAMYDGNLCFVSVSNPSTCFDPSICNQPLKVSVGLFLNQLLLIDEENMAECSITSADAMNIQCDNNNNIVLDLVVEGENTGSCYDVTWSGGADQGTYGSSLSLSLPGGQAYTLVIVDCDDNTCTYDMELVIPDACTDQCDDQEMYDICSDGTETLTLDAAAGVTGVVWFNAAGAQIGTGFSIVIDINTSGLEDGADTFYYTATDAQGCPGELCCPIPVMIKDCCPTENCYGVTVVPN